MRDYFARNFTSPHGAVSWQYDRSMIWNLTHLEKEYLSVLTTTTKLQLLATVSFLCQVKHLGILQQINVNVNEMGGTCSAYGGEKRRILGFDG